MPHNATHPIKRVGGVELCELRPEFIERIKTEVCIVVNHEKLPSNVVATEIARLLGWQITDSTYTRTLPTGWHTDGTSQDVINIHTTHMGVSGILIASCTTPINGQRIAEFDYLTMLQRGVSLKESGHIGEIHRTASHPRQSVIWFQSADNDRAHAVYPGKSKRSAEVFELSCKDSI